VNFVAPEMMIHPNPRPENKEGRMGLLISFNIWFMILWNLFSASSFYCT
jgi:hypothetical protein